MVQVKNIELFKADFFSKSSVGNDLEYKNLLDTVFDLYKKENSNQHTNDNCWRYWNFNIPQWLRKEIDTTVDRVYNFYRDYDPVFKKNQNSYQLNCWVNVNGFGSRNTLHSHSNTHLSGVYYLQANDTGNLRFVNPANTLGNCNYTAPFVRDFEFSPKDRDLVIWPSWVPHEVEPNLTSVQRINIAFDIIFKI